jgi:hypothetical protein
MQAFNDGRQVGVRIGFPGLSPRGVALQIAAFAAQ